MKEFIEKLIGRLEEINHTDYGSLSDYNAHVAVRDCLCDVKRIVNQLAEEYKVKDCSECSRRKWYQIGYADAERALKQKGGNEHETH